MKFKDFKVGQEFAVTTTLTESDFHNYISFARTRNILHENPEIAKKEGVTGIMLPGRSIIARAEGEMTRLSEFADCIMLLYGMDGDPNWQGRQTRYLGEVYAGEELNVRYIVSDKKEDRGYGILAVDYEISRSRDGKLVAVSRRNLYRIKQTS
jgi:acyl dehydratase